MRFSCVLSTEYAIDLLVAAASAGPFAGLFCAVFAGFAAAKIAATAGAALSCFKEERRRRLLCSVYLLY